MRARDFMRESAEVGKLQKNHDSVMPGAYAFQDDGTDRIYNLNRVMMAAAMADGKSTSKIKGIDDKSWSAKNNTAHPYTKEEHNMLKAAFNTIPSNTHHMVSDHKSVEPEHVHKVSPVTGFKGYKRK